MRAGAPKTRGKDKSRNEAERESSNMLKVCATRGLARRGGHRRHPQKVVETAATKKEVEAKENSKTNFMKQIREVMKTFSTLFSQGI